MDTKIAIFDWGGESIHSYYLAKQLSKRGIVVELFLFVPFARTPHFNLQSFFPEGINENIRIIQLNGNAVEDKLTKAMRFTQLLFHPFPSTYLQQLSLPIKTRRVFNAGNYKYIISISIYSLYWVYQTEPRAMKKLLHYSLEIEKITDPHIKRYWKLFYLINTEARLLAKIKGLIIQDRPRLEALLNGVVHPDLRVFFIPVSIPGDIVTRQSSYLHDKFRLDPEQKIILYFGAIFLERKIEQLVAEFAGIENPGWVLVLHGGNVTFPNTGAAANIKTSSETIAYHELYKVFSSATIGVAFYDNSWPNTRLTAFSSEKIARYLQAGVPFIAFANESYYTLRDEFICCELIDNMADLSKAISTILDNYSMYRQNCFRAYARYYNIENTIRPLAAFLLEEDH